jgi:hypothetical protein
MNKRGISPLIISVILVGFTIAIGVTVILWGTNVQKSTIKNQETDTKNLGLLNFDAYYKDSNCNAVAGENCYRLLLINHENFDLGFVIKTHTSLGSHISGPENYILGPYDQKTFDISYPAELGVEEVYAEVDAIKI